MEIGLGTVLRRYVAGHRRLGDLLAQEAERVGLSGNGAALHRIHSTREEVLERLTAAIEHEYDRERRRAGRSRRRLETVQRLLSGQRVDAAAVGELDYELESSWHIALIAEGADADEILSTLATPLHHKLLCAQCEDGTVWAWLGGPQKVTAVDVERVVSPQTQAEVSLAVGEPRRDIPGWRLTHQEAKGAALVTRHSPRLVTRYLDVALEASALRDQALASALVETYLVPLDELRMGGETARDVLRALFKAEHNLSSAAHVLQAHRSTVHRWRNEIEQRLGCRLHEHQAEIEVALRVDELGVLNEIGGLNGVASNGSAPTLRQSRSRSRSRNEGRRP